MVRAIGIDPGTFSFDVCGLEEDRPFLDKSIPSAAVATDPQVLLDLLQSASPVDMIVGPSGYGLPWVSAQDLSPQDMDLLVLSEKRDRGRAPIIGGMRKMLLLLKESGLPICFAPGVIHLPTVPRHRKVNRIDMGTADKLCSVALGIFDQARHLNIEFEETSFVYAELGGAFTAVIAVAKGQVVDGLGGTAGSLGYLSLGVMDGELAYLLGSFHKELLSSGGVASIVAQPGLRPEDFAASAQVHDRSRIAWEAFMEGLIKAVVAEMTVVPASKEILIAGRLSGIPEIRQEVIRRLAHLAPVRQVKGFAQVAKEAAQGAALIAEGLAGGLYKGLVEVMGLRGASGTVLDYLHVAGAEALRRKYLEPPAAEIGV